MPNRKLSSVALAAAVSAALASFATGSRGERTVPDPLLEPAAAACAPNAGQPALLKKMILAATETAPFQPVPPRPALDERPRLYKDLGALQFRVSTKSPQAQAFFNQGVILAFGFNHAEAQRAFREAQRLDPRCAMCFWGEGLILGPNINVPMMPEANAPALAATRQAAALAATATPKEKALIEALSKR